MVRKQIRVVPKAKSTTWARVQRLALLGPPLLLEGEDKAIYDELLARICAAVKPVDVIEDMFVADLVYLQWEVLHWRRLKTSLISLTVSKALKEFLDSVLDFDLLARDFEEALAEDLQQNLGEDQGEPSAQKLARQYVRDEPDAIEKVDKLLAAAGEGADDIFERVKDAAAEEFARRYVQRDPDVIKQVDALLAASSQTLRDIMAEPLTAKIDEIERVDRLITIAETRRNAALREIDRHRAALGQALRRNLLDVQNGEFEEIEATSAQGKDAA